MLYGCSVESARDLLFRQAVASSGAGRLRGETRRGASGDQLAAFSRAPFPRDSAAFENAAGKADLGFRRTLLRKQAACDVRNVLQESLPLKRF